MKSRLWRATRFSVLTVGYLSILFFFLFKLISDSVTYTRVYPSPDHEQVAVAVNYAGGGGSAPSHWSELRIVEVGIMRKILPARYVGNSILRGEYEWFVSGSEYSPLQVRWAKPGLLYVESKAK